MKLVIVTNLIPNYTTSFLNKLIEIKSDLEIVVFADVETKNPLNQYNKDMCNFKVINSCAKNWNGLVFRGNLKKQIVSVAPDFLVIYANPREVTLLNLMVYFWASKTRFFVHGMFHRIGGQTLSTNFYYKLISYFADRCFIYSRKGAEVLVSLGVSPNKISIIGTAIDETISTQQADNILESELFEFKKDNDILDKKVILQVVRLSKIKKPDILITAAQKILAKRNDVLFVLIGGGELFDEIKFLVNSAGLEKTIRLLGPIYDEKILAKWYLSSTVFVMPTCLGLSAHHAFSYGLPIVTDDSLIDQASEFDILCDGLNGLVYKSGDTNSLVLKIIQIIDDEEFACFLSNNARYTVNKLHSLERKALNYLEALGISK